MTHEKRAEDKYLGLAYDEFGLTEGEVTLRLEIINTRLDLLNTIFAQGNILQIELKRSKPIRAIESYNQSIRIATDRANQRIHHAVEQYKGRKNK